MSELDEIRNELAQLRQEVQVLRDIEAIRRLKAKYYRYTDMFEWGKYYELFTDDVVVVWEPWNMRVDGRADLVRQLDERRQFHYTVHHGHMPEIDIIDSTHARAIWALNLKAWYDGPGERGGSGARFVEHAAHQVEEYRKVDGVWLISRLEYSVLYAENVDHVRSVLDALHE